MMHRLVVLVLVTALVAGCASGRAFNRGERAARAGDWDTAAEYYRRALQSDPTNPAYRIALERAMITASTQHLDQARRLEALEQLEPALREYRRASEFDPTNRQVAGKVLEMERRIRDLAESARPQPNITQMRERARQQGEPLLNPASREPLNVRFANSSLRDILNFIGMSTGINVTYERDFQDRTYTVQLEGVTLEQALTQILTANALFYKIVNQGTIMVIPDNAQKRAAYEEQVIRTFFISHADATELVQTLNQVIRIPAIAVQPVLAANKTANTITVRGTTNVVAIIERMIEANDNPRAEVVIDIQILEVNRTRAKEFGLDLSSFSLSGVFSPETDPRGAAQADTGPPPFNLNSLSRGISTADFYLSVPSAVVRFLETDSETKLIAKPQLRGAEGQKITLDLGDEIPVPSTVFTPVAQGGASFNPLTSFNYRTVGVKVEMTPRVTFEGEIVLVMLVESSSLGGTVTLGGQDLPSFGTRRVNTVLRLRDGESNLLAGLLREDERRSLAGFPGLVRLPIIRNLFAANSNSVAQTDIVMLLTPRIVRTHELTQQDVSPIFIGTQQALGLSGPPPLIALPQAAGSATGSGNAPVAVPSPSSVQGQVATTPAGPAPGLPAVQPPPVVAQGPDSSTAPQTAAGAIPTASGQVLLSPPGQDFLVGGGPYTVPVSITGASMLSSVSLTITFNPSAVRVRAVQEGSFMRAGGATATFTQQVDAAAGRIDIVIVRSGDPTGVAGTGLLAAVLLDAVGGGPANLAVTGAGQNPRGTPIPLQFAPVPTVTVR